MLLFLVCPNIKYTQNTSVNTLCLKWVQNISLGETLFETISHLFMCMHVDSTHIFMNIYSINIDQLHISNPNHGKYIYIMFCKGKLDTWNFANRIFVVPNMWCVSNNLKHIEHLMANQFSPGAFVCAVWALGPGLCDAMSRQVVAGTPSHSMLGTKNSWPENLWNGVFC